MLRVVRMLAVLGLTMCFAGVPARAQNAEAKPGDATKGETAKDASRVDEIADAARNMVGLAARPECVWLGERAVGLMWRDDLDTAFRHLELYDRFGCPGEHVQVSFRCVVRHGNIDQKSTETFNARVHTCWVNPAIPPLPTTASSAPPVEKSGTK
jgi:hypothetical protein